MRIRRAAPLAVAALIGVLATMSAGWACVPVATISATPQAVKAGEEVTISGIRFLVLSPVTIRLHGLDGPVVATVEMTRASNTVFKTSFRVPPETKPGPLIVVAEQAASVELGGTNWGVPARTLVTVLDATGKAPPAADPKPLARPATLAKESVSTTALVLVALGVAGVVLLLVGAAALLAGRTPRAPKAATVKTDAVDPGSSAPEPGGDG